MVYGSILPSSVKHNILPYLKNYLVQHIRLYESVVIVADWLPGGFIKDRDRGRLDKEVAQSFSTPSESSWHW